MKHVLKWLKANYPTPNEQALVAKDYKASLTAPTADRVLEDLRRFCYVYDTTYCPGDQQRQNMNAGRHEVYLHIANMLGVEPGDIPTQPEEKTDDRDSERTAIKD